MRHVRPVSHSVPNAQVERLIEDGVDVRGYMYWTLIDNFEWNFAWELKFGIYEWNPDMGMERKLRKGAEAHLSPNAILIVQICLQLLSKLKSESIVEIVEVGFDESFWLSSDSSTFPAHLKL